MTFVRWFILERFLPSLDAEQLFLALIFSLFVSLFLTAVLWPWGLIVTWPVFVFWITTGYVVFTEWLSGMRKEWKDETGGDK